MKWKINNRILRVITVAPLIMALITLNYLPDKIPIHYNSIGVPESFGSKYTILTFPIITIMFSCIHELKQRSGVYRNKSILKTISIFSIISFIIIALAINS